MALAQTEREQLDPRIRSYIEGLESKSEFLEQENERLAGQNATLAAENVSLEEELRLAIFKRFGRSTEHASSESGQGDLFTEAEDGAPPNLPDHDDDTVMVAVHSKKKPGRKPIDPKHARFERIVDVPDEDKQCACGHEMVRMGKEVSERVQIIPEQL